MVPFAIRDYILDFTYHVNSGLHLLRVIRKPYLPPFPVHQKPHVDFHAGGNVVIEPDLGKFLRIKTFPQDIRGKITAAFLVHKFSGIKPCG